MDSTSINFCIFNHNKPIYCQMYFKLLMGRKVIFSICKIKLVKKSWSNLVIVMFFNVRFRLLTLYHKYKTLAKKHIRNYFKSQLICYDCPSFQYLYITFLHLSFWIEPRTSHFPIDWGFDAQLCPNFSMIQTDSKAKSMIFTKIKRKSV